MYLKSTENDSSYERPLIKQINLKFIFFFFHWKSNYCMKWLRLEWYFFSIYAVYRCISFYITIWESTSMVCTIYTWVCVCVYDKYASSNRSQMCKQAHKAFSSIKFSVGMLCVYNLNKLCFVKILRMVSFWSRSYETISWAVKLGHSHIFEANASNIGPKLLV